MTMLWLALLALLGVSSACFINNCPQGGKRSQLAPPAGPATSSQLDRTQQSRTDQLADLRLSRQTLNEKRFLLGLTSRYNEFRTPFSTSEPCTIEGVCTYPDCCIYEQCSMSQECRVLRNGYRLLVQYIFSKMREAKNGELQ